jgi:hypothetical protein
MNSYTPAIKKRVREQVLTLGVRLARVAIARKVSVSNIALCTGATRATVYNWFSGGGVTPAYRDKVVQLTNILNKTRPNDAAWRAACQTFNLPL